MIGKAIGAALVAAVVFSMAVSLMPKDMQKVATGPQTHDDRCSELASQKLPGSFVVMHTDPEIFPDGERNAYRINTYGVNHGGNVDLWCWTGPNGQIEFRAADGPPSWSKNFLTHDRNHRPIVMRGPTRSD
jgi:hypothetical protein